MGVVSWPGRGAKRGVPSLQWPRPAAKPTPVARVELDRFTPDLLVFLGHAAYLELALFETLGRSSAFAPDVRAKETTGRIAETTLARHRGLVAEIERSGHDATESMEPHIAAIDEFRARTEGTDWYEAILANYVAAGLLNDVFVRLAAGLSADHHKRIVSVLEAHDDITVIGEAANGAAALAQVRSLGPDVVLMDVRMPVVDGVTARRWTTGRTDLLPDLLRAREAVRAGQDAALVSSLADASAFTAVLDEVRSAPAPHRIPADLVEWLGTGDDRRPVIPRIEELVAEAAATGRTFAELGTDWARR